MKAKEIAGQQIHGFKVKDILESLLMSAKIGSSDYTTVEDMELNDEALTLMDKFAKELSEKLDAKLSTIYKIISKSPIPYRIIPAPVRDRLLTMKTEERDLNYIDRLGLERTRIKFQEAVAFNTNSKESKNICIITHDVDTKKGLERSIRLKEIEEKYGIESTWFLPTEEYELNGKIVKRLAENGEIASHGTKHDGKLLSLGRGKLVKELRKSKEKLEEIIEKEIHGFRAPLLQYNGKLLEAVGEAGFKYDSSVPTWEPMHPSTMKSDGIELINPITINGLLEIPVTLPQDHQMLHIVGLTPKQTVKLWTTMIEYIYKMGGISVILVHPDYEFASEESIEHYKEIMSALEGKEVIKLKQLWLDSE